MKYTHLSVEERERIQNGLWQKKSARRIAGELERSPSAVSREIRRNLPREVSRYTPRLAHERAVAKRKSRGRIDRLKNDHIRAYVITHLKERWSPEQISGRMKKDGIGNISHEAIYQFIYSRVRKGSNLTKPNTEDLRPYLRRRRRIRLPHGARKYRSVLKQKGRSIDIRPKIVDRRIRIGDWEGDTVESKDHKPGINTLVERKTGYVFITKLKDKTSSATIAAMAERFSGVPERFKLTLTLDNGPENSNGKGIEEIVGIDCFSAHPYHSWERGTNENTNGLIRDYCPKKTDFTEIPDAELRRVEYALNTRPRKRLRWSTPLEVWSGALRG